MNEKPIFVQLMESIEDHIISGKYSVGDLVISSTQMCKLFNVNPVTAMRALSELADGGILIKDRGIGMRVTEDAKAIISERRRANFLDNMLAETISEAKKLGFSKAELEKLIDEGFDNNDQKK